MSETLSDASSRDIQSETIRIPSEMLDFLSKKLGISESDIDGITPDADLIPIIQNLIQNPENETEKKIFLGRYIYEKIIAEAKKLGKGPIDYIDELRKEWRLSFSQGREIKKYYAGKTSAEDLTRISWKEKAATEDLTRISWKEQSDTEKLEFQLKIEEKLKESTERARTSLSPEWQGELTGFIEAKKADPKFLEEMQAKGYTKEQIVSSTFISTIAWYVISEQADNFASKGYIRDGKAFDSALKNINDTLWIPRRLNSILDVPISQWPRRESVIQAGTELLKTGNYNEKSITYNASTGRITFEPNSPTIMKAEIDTSRIPPVLEYVRGSLRIWQDIPPVDPRMKEKKWLEEKKSKLQEVVGKDSAIRFAVLGNGENYEWLSLLLLEKHKVKLDTHRQNQKSLQEIMSSGRYTINPTEALDSLRKLKTSNHDLEDARKSIISMENLGDPSVRALEDGLYTEYDWIQNLERSLGQYAQNADALKKYAGQNTSTDTGFEEAAKWTLARLDEMWYSILWQRNLDRIMAALAYNRSSIWKSPTLDVKSVWDRDLQLTDLQDVANKITAAFPWSPKTYANAFTEISRRMQSLNTGPIMENLWNNPAALSQWLERIWMPQSKTIPSVDKIQAEEPQPQSI